MLVSTCMFKCASISLLKYELLVNDFEPKWKKKKVKFVYIFCLEKMKTLPIYTSHFIPNLDEQRNCIILLM